MNGLGLRPSWPFVLNRNSPQARNLVRWWPLTGATRQEIVTRSTNLALVGAPSFIGRPDLGLCPDFNGTNQALSAAVDLSPYSTLAFSFWLNWTAFSNNDDMVLEFTANGNFNAGGFYFDPNSGVPANGLFSVFYNSNPASSGWSFARPSAAVWHHYLIAMSPGSNPNTLVVYVDGVPQALTTFVARTTTSTFANSTLNFMSRNAASLFGQGQLTDVRIYAPGVTDCAALAWSLFRPQTRWDLYAVPSQRVYKRAAVSSTLLKRLHTEGLFVGSAH